MHSTARLGTDSPRVAQGLPSLLLSDFYLSFSVRRIVLTFLNTGRCRCVDGHGFFGPIAGGKERAFSSIPLEVQGFRLTPSLLKDPFGYIADSATSTRGP